MFTLTNCIIWWATLFAVASFVLAIINAVELKRVKERMEFLRKDVDWYYDYFNRIYDRLDNLEDFSDDVNEYLDNLEEAINHNVDMTNFTLRNFKYAIEKDRKELKEIEQVVEIHQDVLEKQHAAMKILDENINDTLDLIEDIMIYDDLAEEETTEWCCCKTWEDDDFEYFETKEIKKTKRPKTKK